MASEVRDRFNALINAVHRVLDEERSEKLGRDAAGMMQEDALEQLERNQPVRDSSTFVDTGHDHTRIETGWRLPRPESSNNSIRAVVENVSEHLEVQRTGILPGTGEYRIPSGRTFVRFWLGPPLHTPVRDPRAARRGAGYFAFPQIIRDWGRGHFGPWGGSDFVVRSIDDADRDLEIRFQDMAREIVFRPMSRLRFGG